jgi:hypothetical protein
MKLKEWIEAQRRQGQHWTLERVADEIPIALTNLSKAVNGRTVANLRVVQRVHQLTNGAVGLYDWPTGQGDTVRAEP